MKRGIFNASSSTQQIAAAVLWLFLMALAVSTVGVLLTGCAGAPVEAVNTESLTGHLAGAQQANADATVAARSVSDKVATAASEASRIDAKASVLLEHWQ